MTEYEIRLHALKLAMETAAARGVAEPEQIVRDARLYAAFLQDDDKQPPLVLNFSRQAVEPAE